MRANENRSGSERPTPLGLVWLNFPYPLAVIGLARILEDEARVHVGPEPPEEDPSIVIFGVGGLEEGLLQGVTRLREQFSNALILVFGLHLDLASAQAALRAGARGYVHAGMQPKQILRAIKVATSGELVAPRELVEYLINYDESAAGVEALSARQRQILKLVGEGMSNAQIAKELFLTESTIKQHLRSAYKVLGAKNRTEAARLVRNGDRRIV